MLYIVSSTHTISLPSVLSIGGYNTFIYHWCFLDIIYQDGD